MRYVVGPSHRHSRSQAVWLIVVLLAVAVAAGTMPRAAHGVAAPAQGPLAADAVPPTLAQAITSWLQGAYPDITYLGDCTVARAGDAGGLCTAVFSLAEDAVVVTLARPASEGGLRVFFAHIDDESWSEVATLTNCAGFTDGANPVASVAIMINGRTYGPFTVTRCSAL